MSYIVGKNGKVKLATNLVAEVSAFSYSEETEEIEVVAMGQPKRFAGGTVEGSGSVSCNFDPTDTNGQKALVDKVNAIDQTAVMHLQPDSDTAGKYELTGTVSILSWEMTTDAQGIAAATFNFRGKLALSLIP